MGDFFTNSSGHPDSGTPYLIFQPDLWQVFRQGADDLHSVLVSHVLNAGLVVDHFGLTSCDFN
jgi:hypothetical protein